jgi:hypothetical protein
MMRLRAACKGALIAGLGSLLLGCVYFHRQAAFKVVQDYLDAEVQRDSGNQRAHWDAQSTALIAAAGSVIPASPMQQWYMVSYSTSPARVSIVGKKAYVTVSAQFAAPYKPPKNVTFTMFIVAHQETNVQGETEEIWQVDEIQTKRQLAEAVVGKGYGDLWVNQLKTQRALLAPAFLP